MDAAVAGPPRAIDLGEERPFRVGGAAIDPVSRDATFDSGCERLQPQNLKVLIALARRRGEVVTRDELVELCWEGRFVGDDVINRSISTLRQFAERAGGFAIETVPRAGYRLVESSSRARKHPRRRIIAIALALAAAASVTVVLWPGEPARSPQTMTVALLPFATDSADPATRKLAFATHSALAYALSHSRFSAKLMSAITPRAPPVADFIISGDVNSSGDKSVVTVRMEETAHHIVIYSHRFETTRDQLSILPDRIGAQVVGSLGWTPPLLMLDRSHPSDSAVLTELFKESDIENLGGQKGYDTARRVAAKAPDSAIAQISLAFASAFALYILPRDERAEAVANGRRATDRARALAPEFGEPYAPWCLLHSSVRMIECEDRLRAGMRVDAEAPFVAFFLSKHLQGVGRTNEASDLAKRTLAQDQYVPAKIALMLQILEATGQTKEAKKLYRQGIRWWPDFGEMFWARVNGMTDRGDLEAIERFEKEFGKANLPTGYDSVGGLVPAVRANSLAEVRKACPLQSPVGFRTIPCMLALAKVGDLDGAFVLAGKLYPRRVGRTKVEEEQLWLDEPFATYTEYITGPAAAPLRRDPRYLQLAQRVGLLRYWRSGRLPDFCSGHPEPVCAELAPRRR